MAFLVVLLANFFLQNPAHCDSNVTSNYERCIRMDRSLEVVEIENKTVVSITRKKKQTTQEAEETCLS
ncbi:hypothetical protein CAEBREN_11235 [Caenorhabditis brenneri]|uniref:Uncharacterized protein n=1 Tax=Caenorhabditis brenneri TaxID=135651 RepID=G0PAM8_CAEBE|nr:hypothetical protein CAEBREN_11235 [Caenorhabditis brenneri]